MTDKVADAATAVAAPDVELDCRTSLQGPPAIQGPEDGELAVAPMLTELERGVADGADAAIIACFDDTGLSEARQQCGIPIIGIGEAAFHTAMLLGKRFSVVTTLSVSVPVIEENIERYGIAPNCRRVRASEVPVLELEVPGSAAAKRISAEIAAALAEDGCDAIVLGCAGMADLATRLEQQHSIPVIDGVAAATALASAVVRARNL